jgi:hypothetical protein
MDAVHPGADQDAVPRVEEQRGIVRVDPVEGEAENAGTVRG